LIQVASASAHADPSGPISKFDWDNGELYFTGDVAHQNYWNAINALHQISGHAIPNHPEVSGRVSETTLLPTRLIEARLVNAGDCLGSLCWWADNMYFAGFYQDSTHTHYVFPDVWSNEFRQVTGSPRVETLPGAATTAVCRAGTPEPSGAGHQRVQPHRSAGEHRGRAVPAQR
jgi:hypothetical protein